MSEEKWKSGCVQELRRLLATIKENLRTHVYTLHTPSGPCAALADLSYLHMVITYCEPIQELLENSISRELPEAWTEIPMNTTIPALNAEGTDDCLPPLPVEEFEP